MRISIPYLYGAHFKDIMWNTSLWLIHAVHTQKHRIFIHWPATHIWDKNMTYDWMFSTPKKNAWNHHHIFCCPYNVIHMTILLLLQCKHINNSISYAVLSSVPTVIIYPEMQSSCLNISLANITYPPLFFLGSVLMSHRARSKKS